MKFTAVNIAYMILGGALTAIYFLLKKKYRKIKHRYDKQIRY